MENLEGHLKSPIFFSRYGRRSFQPEECSGISRMEMGARRRNWPKGDFSNMLSSKRPSAPNWKGEPLRLNYLEKAFVNSPLRAMVQRYDTARRFARLGGGVLAGGTALETGCGRGMGAEIILDRFGAREVHGFDLDPAMVRLARRRMASRRDRTRFWVGTAAAIAAPDSRYDHVFDFGIIHHVIRWRDAVGEVHRVLKPGGRFYVEEYLKDFICHPVWRTLLDHPQEDRFTGADFIAGLETAGFRLVGTEERFRTVGFFVAEKPGS
jgi:ubiquinone/menaquinone biosynthesis C-methylase UbiE